MGITLNRRFTKADDSFRHWTATIAHIQLVIGFTMYFKSPVIHFFFSNIKEGLQHPETTFFSIIHFLLMLTAIVLISIGSALAKRKENDKEKFKTILTWYLLSLVIIFIAIPWPFSPLVNRPYLRTF